jgi:phage virion morphogenesis protein
MASINVEFNDAELQAIFRQLQDRATNMRPLFAEIGAELLRTTRERFDAERDPDGKPWNPISAAWRREKERKGKSTKILQYNRDLRDSFTMDISQNELTIGTNIIYARVHQLGGGKSKLKARAFLGFSEADKDFIREAALDYLTANR